MILLNNRIYGLTKGQYSPTSPRGFVSKSSPYGTVEDPFHRQSFASVPAAVSLPARSYRCSGDSGNIEGSHGSQRGFRLRDSAKLRYLQ